MVLRRDTDPAPTASSRFADDILAGRFAQDAAGRGASSRSRVSRTPVRHACAPLAGGAASPSAGAATGSVVSMARSRRDEVRGAIEAMAAAFIRGLVAHSRDLAALNAEGPITRRSKLTSEVRLRWAASICNP